MGDGLARVLSKQDFNPDAFVSKQTHGTIEDLESLRQQIAQLQAETSDGLKKNVYKHYHQFIATAKEISILEGEMYQLSHLLTDQKTVMTSMMELSVTGNKVETPDEPDKTVADDDLQKNLAYLLDRVEGCSFIIHVLPWNDPCEQGVTEVPGRFLVHSGDLVETDAESFATIQKVSIFLLNDCLMIATLMPNRRGPVKYRFHTLYELDNLAVVNVKDTNAIKNAFKLLMFPDTRLFQAESPKAKRQWLVILEETKRKKMAVDSQRKESAMLQDDAGYTSDSACASLMSPARSSSAFFGNSIEGTDLLHVDWVQELPEDLDVCIAQRDFEGAVDLVQKIYNYLDGCPKTSSVREYRSRVEHRVEQLTAVLVHELQLSPERSIKGGPRSARRAVVQLIRLGKSVQACELFLCNRSAMCRYSLRQLKAESNAALYVTSMCRMFFTSLIDTAKEFLKAFPQHLGCFSAFVLWAKQELQYFVGVFAGQVFVTKYNLSTVAECVTEARNYCQQLSEIGIELGFILDRLLSSDLNKLIQQAGDNQMDAIRHRAADDNWRPVNYQNEDNVRKFEADMKQLGIEDISRYTYDGCMTYLTANTIQFTRSYLSFCGDLLKVYTPDRQHLITSAFTDILNAHVSLLLKAVASGKYQNESLFVGQSSHFICNSLIPVVKNNYLRTTGIALHGIDELKGPLKDIQAKTVAARV